MNVIDITTATAPTFADVQTVLAATNVATLRADVRDAARRILANEDLATVAARRVFRSGSAAPVYAYRAPETGSWVSIGVVGAAKAVALGDVEVRKVVKG